MMKYKAAICDDDKTSTQYVKRIIAAVSNVPIEFCEYSSGEELLQNIGEEHQLIILDIALEGINGFETAKKVRERNRDAVLVFCSGEFDPTPESFDVVPYRYLKKQYSEDKLRQEFRAVLKRVDEIFKRKVLAAKDGEGNLCQIQVRQITYISKAKRGSVIHLLEAEPSGGEYYIKSRVEELYEELATCGFGWPHSSYIVNIRFVDHLNDKELTLRSGEILSVARSKYKQFVEVFMKYWEGKYQYDEHRADF